jgi:metal-responsive CopG/Arc/MetJ family transcriptional regulator
MKSLLVQMDEPTFAALNRVTAKRERAEFVRQAIRRAIREFEEDRTRAGYLAHPDREGDGDNWANAERWNP